MDIKIVRLSSGEEIICNYKEENEGLIVINDPGIIIPVGQGEIGIMPWLAYAKTKDGIVVDKRFVVFVVEPQTDFANQYKTQFVPAMSGLVTPPQKKVLTPSLKLAD